MHFWAGAQSVEAIIVEYRAEDQNGYLITPVISAVKDWEARYTPDLFAYPVELEINIGNQEAILTVEDAAKSTLLIEYTANAAGGAVVCRTTHGITLWKQDLPVGKERVLLDILPAESVLSFVGGSEVEAEAVQITRIYIKPMHDNVQRDLGFGESDICHPNAPCPENDPWRDQMRSSVRIRMTLEEGIGWCSGTLLNNTARDGTPYILSAEHCLALNTPMWDLWRFDFNYVSPTCENPAEEPVANSLTGCVLKSKHRDTDFMLLVLDQNVPLAYKPFFSGWNRTPNVEPVSAALIHHPSGDIMKVSRDHHAASYWVQTINWQEGYSTPPGSHIKNKMDKGSFEPGSSGGALYDPDGYVIGQLHGGLGDCSGNTMYSGGIAASWNYGDMNARLYDYLDPIGEENLTLEGMEHPDLGNSYTLQGTISDPYGAPVGNVKLSLKGDVEMTVDVDSTGVFNIGPLSRLDTVTFSARKTVNPTNGVSALDLLLIKQHLLGTKPFTEPHQVLAADATANDIVSASDILFLQKLLLGIIPFLPSQPSWIFSPSEITISNPEGAVVPIMFTAIKIGDVNGTADPNK